MKVMFYVWVLLLVISCSNQQANEGKSLHMNSINQRMSDPWDDEIINEPVETVNVNITGAYINPPTTGVDDDDDSGENGGNGDGTIPCFIATIQNDSPYRIMGTFVEEILFIEPYSSINIFIPESSPFDGNVQINEVMDTSNDGYKLLIDGRVIRANI